MVLATNNSQDLYHFFIEQRLLSQSLLTAIYELHDRERGNIYTGTNRVGSYDNEADPRPLPLLLP